MGNDGKQFPVGTENSRKPYPYGKVGKLGTVLPPELMVESFYNIPGNEIHPEILNGIILKDGAKRMQINEHEPMISDGMDPNGAPLKDGKNANKNNFGKGANKKNANTNINSGETTEELTGSGHASSPPSTNSTKGKKDRKSGMTQNSSKLNQEDQANF